MVDRQQMPVIPADRNLELNLLGAVALDYAFLERIDLRPEDFYFSDHARLYAALLDIHASGEPFDTYAIRGTRRGRFGVGLAGSHSQHADGDVC